MKANYVIVRRPGGLRALRVEPSIRKVKRVKRLVVETSLRGVAPGDELCLVDDEARDLARAWQRLGRATLSHQTWYDLFLLLLETPAAPVTCLEPVPRLDAQATVDVRRWLCDPEAVADLLVQLQGYARRVVAKHPTGCDLWRALFPRRGPVGDPYLLFNHHTEVPLAEQPLGPVHLEQVLPWLQGLAWEDVRIIVERWETLHQVWPEAAWLVLSQTDCAAIAGWLQFFGEYNATAAGERAGTLRLWMIQGGAKLALNAEWRELSALALQLPDVHREAGLRYVWGALRDRRDPARVLAGLSLWILYDWKEAPSPAGVGGDCSTLIEKVCSLLPKRKDQRRSAHRLFRIIGTNPGCTDFLRRLLEGEHACSPALFQRLLGFIKQAETGRTDVRVLWKKLARNFALLCSFLEEIPEEYFWKALNLFDDLYWKSFQVDPDLADHLTLISKLCRKPLCESDGAGDVLTALLIVDSKENVRYLASLPESSWRRFDEACRSNNRSERMVSGVRRLIRGTLPIVLGGLKFRVRCTMRVLQILGEHDQAPVEAILRSVLHHPLYGIWLRKENYARHLPVLRYSLGRAASDSLSKLQEMHEGRRPARPDVIRKLLADLQGQVIEALLFWIEEQCVEDLRERAAEFGGKLEIHTVRLAADIDCNRRVFRRMLRGYTREGEAAIWRHHLNRYWLSQQHEIVARGWLRPHDIQVETESHGVLTLWIEQRFEEALRMGTVVHSCLAIGGCYAYSVVANALDANKQFVVAYDGRGEFVARQLIAISEEGRLVCFPVYARKSMNSELLGAFSAFDRHLAGILGVPIEREEEDYTIKNLVCRDWYDDYFWNPLEIEQPARIVRVEPGGGGAELNY